MSQPKLALQRSFDLPTRFAGELAQMADSAELIGLGVGGALTPLLF